MYPSPSPRPLTADQRAQANAAWAQTIATQALFFAHGRQLLAYVATFLVLPALAFHSMFAVLGSAPDPVRAAAAMLGWLAGGVVAYQVARRVPAGDPETVLATLIAAAPKP